MSLVTRSTVVAVVFSLVPVSCAWACSQMLVDAKKAGLPARNCQYCHTKAIPALNDRGKFLMADKQARNLKAVNIDKLKDFPGGKEQQ